MLETTVPASHLLDSAKFSEASSKYHVVDRVYLFVSSPCTIGASGKNSQVHIFSVDNSLFYNGFCDDFGPMGLRSVFDFCNILEEQLEQHPNESVALSTSVDSKALTNAVFLMGSYLIMKRNWVLTEVKTCFQQLNHRLSSFRDVSPGKQNFHLYVDDCWGGLLRAKQSGWVDFGPNGFQADEYSHYDDADMHEIIPNKLIAMRGPRSVPAGSLWFDHADSRGEFSHRDFSPAYYAEILQEFGVQAVVRLNQPEYSDQEFRNAGIAVADLQFDDCTAPPVDVVAKFLLICENLPGAIAVHCKAGLGRTGTLIALYLLKHHAFSAREAMGWLRIVRPGSVIGEQQRFLCEREALMHRARQIFQARAETAGPGTQATGIRVAASESTVTDPAGIPAEVPVTAGPMPPAAARQMTAASPRLDLPRPLLAAPPADVAAVQKIIDDSDQHVESRIENMLRKAAALRRRGSRDGSGGGTDSFSGGGGGGGNLKTYLSGTPDRQGPGCDSDWRGDIDSGPGAAQLRSKFASVAVTVAGSAAHPSPTRNVPVALSAGGGDEQRRGEAWLGAHVMSASNARVARRAASDLSMRYSAAAAAAADAAAGGEAGQEIDALSLALGATSHLQLQM